MSFINTRFFRIIGSFILLFTAALSLHAEVTGEQAAEQARELIQLLAEDGSESSYQELESFFKNAESVEVLFHGESGVHNAFKAIRNMLNKIGDKQTESSYEALLSFRDIEYEGSVFYDDAYGTLISNLLKHRETKSEDLTDILESELDRMLADQESIESEHSFLLDENVFFQKERKARYITEDGTVVYDGRAKPATSAGTILNGLYLIESEASYAVIESFLTSWPGRESSDAFEYPEMRLKQRRYDLPVIEIYEAMMRDTRYLKDSRANFVKHFFDNSVVHYARREIEDPEQDFAQIENASEEALLRMLDVTNYASSLDFLPTETVDLVYAKRTEIIDRLVGIGYSRKELNQAKVTEPEVGDVVKQSKPAIEEATEVVTSKPTKEPAKQPSQWWLWLVGALVVVGGLAVVVCRKS